MGLSTNTALIEKLDSVSFDSLLADQQPFEMEQPIFDLTGVRFITPGAQVELAAACYSLNAMGCSAEIILDNFSVRSYLARAGFVEAVRPVAHFSPPIGGFGLQHLRGSNPSLIELTKIESGSELPGLLDKIVTILRKRLGYAKYDAFDIVTAVSEICQNTFDHNAESIGFLAMQTYRKDEKDFLEIGVADNGEGLTTTLRRNSKNPDLNSDYEAIQFAIQPGTSEHDDRTRGTGLHHLLEIAYKHEGLVQIRSGDAKARYRMDKREGWKFDVSWMPGVHITLNLTAKGKA